MPAASQRTNDARYVVLGAFCLAAMIAYMQRTAIGVVAGNIRSDFGLSTGAMGFVMSGYYWTYAFSQLPAGWLGQRFGSRWMLPACVALSSACAAALAFSSSWVAMMLVWLLAGITIAGIFPCCVQSIVRWFPAHERAFPSGALGSSMSVGGAVSTALTGWLVKVLAESTWPGWRVAFVLYALPGLLWAAVFPWWFRERPAEAEPVADDQPRPAAVEADDSPEWWTDSRTILICLQQFLRAAGYVFYATWFPSYLQETRGVSTAEAGLLTSLPLLGVVAGGAVGGWAIDRIDRWSGSRRVSRQLVGALSHTVCGLLIFAAAPIQNATVAVSVISLGSLAFALGSATSYAITMDLGGRRAATLFAVMNMCGNIGAALCPLAVGLLVPHIGWDAILWCFGGIYLGVACCWAFLDPTPRTVSA